MPSNAFEYFLQRRNARLVRMLERNREIAEMIQGLLENIEEHCVNKGLDVAKVGIRDAFVTSDGVVTLRIVPRG